MANINIHEDVERVLVTEEELRAINARLGKQITEDFRDKKLLIIGILKGSIYFMTDLTRFIDLPLEIDFLGVSSYGGSTRTSGEVRIVKDLDKSIEGYDVLLIEDILDTGRTLDYVKRMLLNRKARSISICTLLDKPDRRAEDVDVKADYVGCDVPNEFVIGYGLDYNQKYRNLPYIGVIKQSAVKPEHRKDAE